MHLARWSNDLRYKLLVPVCCERPMELPGKVFGAQISCNIMGIGKAQRRRAKNAEIANVSLHKAALGKRGASAHIPLPSAPTKDDYTDRMPASLRKMLALKEAVERPLKRRNLDEGRSQPKLPSGVLPQDSSSTAPTGQKKRKLLEEPAQQLDQRVEQKQVQQDHQKERNQAQEQQRQQAQAVGAAAVWQEPKRLKQRKKEYLKGKQLKKKGKHRPAADDLDLQSDRPAFGEVVHAPPVVALKSKHWAAGTKQQQQQQQQQHSGAHAAKGSSRKPRQKQGIPTQQRAKDQELDHVREQMIEVYRAGRPSPSEGQATLQSLKALVKRQVAPG